jgi:hypothetical protein
MLQDYHLPNRDWREIAAEAMNETDPKKRAQLCEELERALDERDKARRERIKHATYSGKHLTAPEGGAKVRHSD